MTHGIASTRLSATLRGFPVQRETRVSKGLRVIEAMLGLRVPMELPELKDLLDHKALLDRLARKG
jgi:hypothetical protein